MMKLMNMMLMEGGGMGGEMDDSNGGNGDNDDGYTDKSDGNYIRKKDQQLNFKIIILLPYANA